MRGSILLSECAHLSDQTTELWDQVWSEILSYETIRQTSTLAKHVTSRASSAFVRVIDGAREPEAASSSPRITCEGFSPSGGEPIAVARRGAGATYGRAGPPIVHFR